MSHIPITHARTTTYPYTSRSISTVHTEHTNTRSQRAGRTRDDRLERLFRELSLPIDDAVGGACRLPRAVCVCPCLSVSVRVCVCLCVPVCRLCLCRVSMRLVCPHPPTEKLRGSSAAVEGLNLRFPSAHYYALLASYYYERPAAYEALYRELVPVWANVHLPILFAALAYRAVRTAVVTHTYTRTTLHKRTCHINTQHRHTTFRHTHIADWGARFLRTRRSTHLRI